MEPENPQPTVPLLRDPATLSHCPECDDPFYVTGFGGRPICYNHDGYYMVAENGVSKRIEVGIDD